MLQRRYIVFNSYICVSVDGDILKAYGFDNPSVCIFTTAGQNVFSGKGDNISLSMLAKGIYIVNVKDATRAKTIKIAR